MINKINPYEFQNTLNKYLDFHRNYLFRVHFFDKGNENLGFITDLVSATETPISTTSQLPLGWMGSKLKIAGKTDFNDWKVTVRDDLTNKAYRYFHIWRDTIYILDLGISNSIVDYKKNAIIFMLPNKSLEDNTIARRYIITGIWPKDIGSINLDFTSEGIATFPVTFSVDYFEAADG